MKREIQLYNFKSFGSAIKEARNEHKMSRKDVRDRLDISPRYLASIENNGQHPSLQIFYELVTLLDILIDQFFFSNKNEIKTTRRRQLDKMDDKDPIIMSSTAKGSVYHLALLANFVIRHQTYDSIVYLSASLE